MKVGSLFSGIGGLDLGLERAGMTVAWQSEIDPYASKVLAKHWPHIPNLGDITKVNWDDVEPVDLVCGGYPCQPFSLAGVRRGESDPRHLWPHFHRAIRHLRPRYALLENVPGHLSLGFDRVLGDLAEIGYDVEWCCVPAAAVGAPHLRWRVFAIAYPHGESQSGVTVDAVPRPRIMVPDTEDTARRRRTLRRQGGDGRSGVDGTHWDVADTDRDGHGGAQDGRGVGRVDGGDAGAPRQRQRARPVAVDRGETLADAHEGGRRGRPGLFGTRRRGQPADGDWWAAEPDVGRVAHGIPHRVDRLRCLGNAVVPQVVEWIGERIMKADRR